MAIAGEGSHRGVRPATGALCVRGGAFDASRRPAAAPLTGRLVRVSSRSFGVPLAPTPCVASRRDFAPAPCASASSSSPLPSSSGAGVRVDPASSSSLVSDPIPADLAPLVPVALADLVRSFRSASDPMARYKQLIHLGSRLARVSPAVKRPENRVPGCVSSVWIVAEPGAEAEGVGGGGSDRGREAAPVRWHADSDSALTKGLAALLVLGFGESTPAEVLRTPIEVLALLGFEHALTPSRSNGLRNMFLFMQRAARRILGSDVATQAGIGSGRLGGGAGEVEGVRNEGGGGTSGRENRAGEVASEQSQEATAPFDKALPENGISQTPPPPQTDASASSSAPPPSPMAAAISSALSAAFAPSELTVGIQGSSDAPGGLQVAVRIRSDALNGLSTLKRSRSVKKALSKVPGIQTVTVSLS